MKSFLLPLATLCVALAVTSPCRADDVDKEKPINFQGDTGGYSQASNTGDLTGNAIITQGTLRLQADRITFKRNADNSFSAVAYGSPVTFRQRRDGSDEYDEAFAQRIAYDGQKQLVELFDHALLKRGPTNEMRSDYIAYDRAKDYATFGTPAGEATAGRPASRVSGVILPKDINNAEKGKGEGKGAGEGDKGKSAGDADKAKGSAAGADKAATAPAKAAPPEAPAKAPAAGAPAAGAKGTPSAPGSTAAGAAADTTRAAPPLTIDTDLKSQ
jgi:lipopolysaccharide export system protein LptA